MCLFPPGSLLSKSCGLVPFCAVEEASSLGLKSLISFVSSCLPALPLGSSVDILATDDPDFTPDDQQDTRIYEKHDNLLHGTKKKK